MNYYPDLSNTNYEIIRELGRNREGGRVSYLATNKAKQKVVIKQFRFFCSDSNWHGFKIYEREVNFLKELNHPRIPHYIDSFETKDGFCLVQEFKDAPSLANLSNLSPENIKLIAISVLEILQDLQQRKPVIIHRDLKPENILIDSDYNAYLIDFGLAKKPEQDIAISSIAMGTPGFMPPEEVFNRSVTEASDLYSLGATLICLLTQTPSVEISSLIDDNYRFNFQHKLSGINPLFIEWLSKMIEPNLKQRFNNASAALEVIKSIEVCKTNKNYFPHFISQNLFQKIWIILGILTLKSMIVNYFSQPSPQVVQSQSNSQTLSSHQQANSSLNSSQQWFQNIKPHCNSLEVITTLNSSPAPKTTEGIGYTAACYALAGKIEMADELIKPLTRQQQEQVVNIVFNIGHPVADAGDDESAGPIMNLVVKYQPSNYMALYHAGMSAYILGDLNISEEYLQSFLQIYQRDDAWRQNAIIILKRISN